MIVSSSILYVLSILLHMYFKALLLYAQIKICDIFLVGWPLSHAQMFISGNMLALKLTWFGISVATLTSSGLVTKHITFHPFTFNLPVPWCLKSVFYKWCIVGF